MKKTLAVLLALVLTLGCITAFADADKPVVKIGACYVETGGGSAANIDWVKPAVEMAIEDFNARDDAKFTVELVTRDCQNDSSLVGTKYSELKAEGVVGIIGPNNASHGAAGLQWAETNELPVIVTSFVSSTAMNAATSKWGFCSGVSGYNLGRVIGRAIMDADNHSIFFIALEGTENREEFAGLFGYLDEVGYDYELQGETWISYSDTDYTAVVNAAMSGNPDAVCVFMGGAQGAAFLQQGQMYGMFETCDIYATNGLGSDWTMSFGEDFPEGVISNDIASWHNDSAENASYYEWSRRFFERADLWPSNFTNGYSIAIYTMLDAVEAAFDEATGTVDSAKVAENLETMNFDIPIGPVHYSSLEAGHNALFPVLLVTSVYDEEYGLAYGDIISTCAEDIFMSEEQFKTLIEAASAA